MVVVVVVVPQAESEGPEGYGSPPETRYRCKFLSL